MISIRIANRAGWSQNVIPFWVINLCKYPKVRKNSVSNNMIIKWNLYKMTKWVDWTCTISGHLISTKNPVVLFFAWIKITNMQYVANIIKVIYYKMATSDFQSARLKSHPHFQQDLDSTQHIHRINQKGCPLRRRSQKGFRTYTTKM